MFLELDLNSEIPIYIQIKDQIILLIAKKQLTEGDKLPSVRQLATDIGVNLHTINKAYNLLKESGFLVVNRRKGVLVNEFEGYKYSNDYLVSVRELLNPIIVESLARGLSMSEMSDLMTTIYQELEGEQNG